MSLWADNPTTRRLFDAVADALMVIDEQGRLVGLNVAARQALALTNDKIIGATINILAFAGYMLADEENNFWSSWQEFVNEIDHKEVKICRPDGMAIRAVYQKRRNFSPGLNLLIFHLLEEEKWLTEAPAEKLPPATLPPVDLAAITLHEVRNLLSAVSISATLLRQPDALTGGRGDQILQRIDAQIQRINLLLNDMPTAEKWLFRVDTATEETIDLAALCAEVVEEMRRLTPQTIDFRGQYLRPPTIRGDLFLLRYALTNLLFNAIKYSPPDGRIRVELVDADENSRIRVIDSGIGIPEADLPHIFDTTYRGSNVGKALGGGLGLPMAQTIIHRYGGNITCASRPGAGTTFTVDFPKASW